jgi:hypothetical protein
VTDEQDVVVVGGEPSGLDVDLRHQRAGGVDRLERTPLRLLVDDRATPCAENTTVAPSGTSSVSSTKIAPALLEGLDDVAVVHDLLADVDRRAVQLQRLLDRHDGPVHTGAVATRRGEQDTAEVRRGSWGHAPMVGAASEACL